MIKKIEKKKRGRKREDREIMNSRNIEITERRR